jgi:putative flippase GtrA
MNVIVQLLKYCVVGFSGMIIDFGVTWTLKEKLHVNKYIANSTGFIISATSNYILNRVWTFNSNDDHVAIEYFQFFSISLIGLALNNLIIYLLSDKLQWNFYISKFIAIAVFSRS